MIAVVTALLLSVTPAELEKDAQTELVAKYTRAKQRAPVADPALNQAARLLAKRALIAKAADIADLSTVTDAVSGANGHDPSPRALVMRAAPAEYTLESLKGRGDLLEDETTHFGVGAAINGDRGALVVLLSQRKAALQPFPRAVREAGNVHRLCGDTLGGLRKPEVFITSPTGDVAKIPLQDSDGASFCATVPLPKEGRYTVEVIARANRGPEVAALFFTYVGAKAKAADAVRTAEPTTVATARVALLEKINALREGYSVKPVVADKALHDIAQAYAERMSKENFFSHVAPDGVDMRSRLKAAAYDYRTAGENLGSAGGPLAAHFGIEHSPGHRRNLLEPSYTHVGLGVAFRKLPDRTQVILVELFAQPDRPSFDPLGDTYEELSRARAAKGLKAFTRSEVLEQIAFDHAKKALAANTPKASLKGHKPVHERVFAATRFKTAAVDVFVAESLTAVSNSLSKNAADPANDQVGIGSVKGDSQTYGAGRYWVVVIYAASR